MILSSYRLLSTVLEPLIYGWLKLRQRRGKESLKRFGERLGKSSTERPEGDIVWVHCASVGEAQSAIELVRKLLESQSDIHALVTTGTVTSAAYMEGRLPDRAIHQFVPVDVPRYVKRFLNYWRPAVGLWFESELWPNLVMQAGGRGVQMVLVNGRMSEKSIRQWHKWPRFISGLLKNFRQLLVQTDQDKTAYESLGAENVYVTGNLKFASLPLAFDEGELKNIQQQIGSRPVWLAASTHEPEEVVSAHVHGTLQKEFPHILTIVVLRHPNRSRHVFQELRSMGLNVAVRAKQDKIYPDTDVYLVDTLGELGLFFRLSEIVFMGGSIAKIGGHNLLEPAQLNSVVLHGPHMFLQQDIMQAFMAAGASIDVQNEDDLASQIATLLNDMRLRESYQHKAEEVTQTKAKVLEDVLVFLRPIMKDAFSRKGDV